MAGGATGFYLSGMDLLILITSMIVCASGCGMKRYLIKLVSLSLSSMLVSKAGNKQSNKMRELLLI